MLIIITLAIHLFGLLTDKIGIATADDAIPTKQRYGIVFIQNCETLRIASELLFEIKSNKIDTILLGFARINPSVKTTKRMAAKNANIITIP